MTSTTSFEWHRLAQIQDGLHVLLRYKGELCRVEKTALPSSGNERQRDRLIQQAELVKSVDHKGIVKLFEYGVEKTLKELIESRGGRHFNEQQVLKWAGQLVQAIRYLHKRSILHKNITSDNVVISDDLKVAKFNNLRKREFDFAYVSPEEASKRDRYSSPSEIWSFGVLMYEMVSLKRPFIPIDGESSWMQVIERSNPPPIPLHYTSPLRELIQFSCLELDPEQRATIKTLCRNPYLMKYSTNKVKVKKLAKEHKAQLKVYEQKLKQLEGDKLTGNDEGIITRLESRVREMEKTLEDKSNSFDQRLQQKEAQLSTQQNTIEELKKSLQDVQSENDDMRQIISDFETVLNGKMASEMEDKRQIQELEAKLNEAKQENAKLLETLEATRKQKQSKENKVNYDLIDAAKEGDSAAVMQLIKQGVDLEVADDRFCGNTALIWSAKNGHARTASILLENEAQVNASADDGTTALHCSSIEGHLECCQVLVEHGANVEAKNFDGNTPLIFAADAGHEEVVALLLDKGADPNETNKNGSTPLIQASAKGFVEIAKALLDAGAIADIIDYEYGSTALIEAAGNGHHQTVQVLIDQGADPNKKALDGATALMSAAACGHLETVRILLQVGKAQVDATNDQGVTALIVAAQNGHVQVCKLLLSHGANAKHEANHHLTAMAIAKHQNHTDIVRLLRGN